MSESKSFESGGSSTESFGSESVDSVEASASATLDLGPFGIDLPESSASNPEECFSDVAPFSAVPLEPPVASPSVM